MSWKDVVKNVAPVLGTMLGGPLAGGAVKVLAETVLGGSSGDPVQDEAQLAGILAGGMTPELQARVIEAQNTVKTAMIQAGIREKEIEAETERAYLADSQQARATMTAMQASEHVPWYIKAQQPVLALLAVSGFLAVLGVLLWITASSVVIDASLKDILVFALGALTGVVLTVYNFFFGTSDGSRRNQEKLADLASKR